jgi:tripartite-type tricarboxylate transporter receptor subunit TctC
MCLIAAPWSPTVIGGRITMTLQNMGVLLPHVREGRLRGIAVTSLKRSAVIDLPTVAESGLPGFEATSWFGLMAPAGTPRAVVAKVHQDALKVAAMPDVRDKLTALGLDTASDGPEALAAIIKADIAKWAKVIKDANIKAGN